MIKSAFFDFFNRTAHDFSTRLQEGREDEDYIDWNGYFLPMDYGDGASEYSAIRERCALFDVSPIRKYSIRGAAAGRFFDYLLTRPVSDAPNMRGIYVAYCNEDGSLKDDSILYKFADDDYLLMPSDIDHSLYFKSLRVKLGISKGDLEIVDCTREWLGVAVQGPWSATVLTVMGFNDVENLKPFEVREYQLAGSPIQIARMGFTADLGYECWLRAGQQHAFEQLISAARTELGIEIPGYGLTALESCRLEGGFVVAGWDFATEADPFPGFERSPYELGLGWLVNLEAEDFVGRDALVEQVARGPRFVLRTMQADHKAAPEDGTALHAEVDGRSLVIGSVNCSAWSWSLDRRIGNVSIVPEYAELKTAWYESAGEEVAVTLGKAPPLRVEHRNQLPAAVHLPNPRGN